MRIIRSIKNLIRSTPFYEPLCRFSESIEAKKWEKGSQCGPAPHIIKQKIVKDYARRFVLDTLIETGTCLGKMVSATQSTFSEIFSIELDKELFRKAKQKFAGQSHIHIIHGDSAKILPEILASIKKPCLFWLDAHYSGDITARGDKATPVADELKAILRHAIRNHVILIDDARCFTGENDYPTAAGLKDYVLEQCPGHSFKIECGVIMIYPSEVK